MSPRKPSRPPPPPGEFLVQVTIPHPKGLGAGNPEIIEHLCANEQEGWAIFYAKCRTMADIRLFRNGVVVARQFPPREGKPS
jgi:hypothetical protein